jgi:arginyl-tRNA synthetase
MVRITIKKVIQSIIDPQYASLVSVFPNSNLGFGDYTTNIVMIIAAKEKKKPKEVGEEIVKELKNSKIKELIEKIKLAESGYINFYLKQETLLDNLDLILTQNDNYGNNQINLNKKFLVEFTDPNPFKEFHIGHLFSNAVGEAIARLFEYSQAEVIRVCYQGDVGLHVAKTIWALKKYRWKDYQEQLSVSGDSERKVQLLGDCYVQGNKFYEDDEAAKQEIQTLNQIIYQHSNREINAVYQQGRQWSLDYFESLYQKLGTNFNNKFFESETGIKGREIVEEGLKKGVFAKSEGAVIFPGEKYQLHTRVFINKLGLASYFRLFFH